MTGAGPRAGRGPADGVGPGTERASAGGAGPRAERDPADCAPYYLVDAPHRYHTRLDCPTACAAPEGARRFDHARLIERLPYW